MSQHTGHETDTPDEPTGLTQAQEQAITALLTEPTIARAAQAVGVSERTLHRWLARPDFRAHYLKARRNVFDQAVALTHKYAPLAVNTLARTLSDPSAPWATRTAAAVALLRIGREGLELDDMAQRIAALEATVQTQQTRSHR